MVAAPSIWRFRAQDQRQSASGALFMAGEQENLVRRMYEEAWNEGRLDVIDEVCAPDYVGVGP